MKKLLVTRVAGQFPLPFFRGETELIPRQAQDD
jgi:hypothetical protein